MIRQKAADWPPFVFDLNFSSSKPSPDYALVTISIISEPSVIITLFFKDVPVQSIQVTIYPVTFPLTKTAIFSHAVNLVENFAQLFVEPACFTPVKSSLFNTLFNLLL